MLTRMGPGPGPDSDRPGLAQPDPATGSIADGASTHAGRTVPLIISGPLQAVAHGPQSVHPARPPALL